MPMFRSVSSNAFQITSPEGAFLDPQWTADFLEGVHQQWDGLVLETAITKGGFEFFVRTQSGRSSVQSYLQTTFRPTQKSVREYWLSLPPGQDTSVITLYLTDHALLPTAGYSDREIVQRWKATLEQARGDGGDPGLRLGVRALLQPAQPDWREAFVKRLSPSKASGGIASWFWASDAKEGSAGVDPEMVAAKASGPAFSVEVQVVAIYKTEPAEKRRAKAALDRVTKSVVDLLGGDKVWRKTKPKDFAGHKFFESGRPIMTKEPWDLTRSFAPGRPKRFALSPREAAPLWPVSQAMPRPAPVETLLTPRAAPEPDFTPGAEASPAAMSTAMEAPVRGGRQQADRGEDLSGQPTATIMPASPVVASSDEEKTTWNSARPPRMPVTQMPKRNALAPRGPQVRRDPDRRSAVIAAARASAVQDRGLSERDLLIFDQQADLPLGSAQDVAYAYGWSPTTCYESQETLKGLDLAKSAELNTGGGSEERFWISDYQWQQVMGDRPLPHTNDTIGWLWLNPRLAAAVYRLMGMTVRARPGRQLIALRWLRNRPFDAVAQCTDGWAVFMWSGIWQDPERLQDRLRKCADEFNRHWGGGRGTHWPGRIVCVVPHAWQAERVWRTVAGSEWKDSCAVYDLEGDTLTGDLDLRSSRGRVPFHIHDNPSPPRADLARWIDLLANDTAGHWIRLLLAVEQHPDSIPSHLQHLTRLSGTNVQAGLEELSQRDLIYQTPDQGYALQPWPLAMAARRDRVWVGLPSRRFGPDTLADWSDQRRKRWRDTQRLLAKFAAAGCSVAPGWQASDGRFRPDGVVWMNRGPYGPGWHYVMYASRAQRESTVGQVLARVFSDTRTDQYPVLLACTPAMEETFWRLGVGRPMLTASVSRIRSGPVVGRESTVWLRYGESVPVLAGPRS